MSIDDLRRQAMEEELVVEDPNQYLAPSRSDKLFGMTAAERMFVSVGCFFLTTLGGFLLLLVMDKIALP